MRLSVEHIKSLRGLFGELGLDYSDEQVQEIGMAIMRFVLVKMQQIEEITSEPGVKRNG